LQETLNGNRIHWRESGSGDPVLFLHAFPLHSGMWDKQLQDLPQGWRGIAPDLRGFGRTSGWGVGPYTMDVFADDMAQLLNHLRISKVVLCGCSMGGYISFAFHRKYRERVRALVLCNTRPAADSAESKQARLQLAARVRTEGPRVLTETMLPKLLAEESKKKHPELVNLVQQMLHANPQETLARALEGMAARPNSEEVVRNIDVPALIIHGAEDAVIPRGDAQMMARGIRGAKLQLLESTGHLANLEQPVEFNRFLNDFLVHLPPSYGTLKFA
jgi:pimeloyl-ACP methyl ester carboxylesterase